MKAALAAGHSLTESSKSPASIAQSNKQCVGTCLTLLHRQRNSDAEEMLHRIDGHTAAVTFDDFADGGDADAGAFAVTLP